MMAGLYKFTGCIFPHYPTTVPNPKNGERKVLIKWRLGSESNRRTRLCRPLNTAINFIHLTFSQIPKEAEKTRRFWHLKACIYPSAGGVA